MSKAGSKSSQKSLNQTDEQNLQISSSEIPFSEFQCNPIARRITDTDIRSRIVLLQTIADGKENQNIIFVTDDQKVFAFGDNTEGCLGVGHTNPCWEEPVLLEAFTGKKIIQIASGLLFTIVLCASKECYSFGSNRFGQLCQGKEPNNVLTTLIPEKMTLSDIFKLADITFISCGESFGALMSSEGDVFTFGSNQYGQLAHNFYPAGDDFSMYCFDAYRVIETDFVTQVACGANHIAMLNLSGKIVYLCGDNRFGQLGLSSKKFKSICRPFRMNFTRRKVVSIACGRRHTMLLTFPGLIFAFGSNIYGQLGSKSTEEDSDHVPRKIEINTLFDQLYSQSLSNLSMAFAPQEQRMYVWGEVYLAENGRSDRVEEPIKTNLQSPAKTFALLESKSLMGSFTFSNNFSKGRKIYGREFEPVDQKANMGFLFEKGCFFVDKTMLAMFTDYFSRKYPFDNQGDMSEMLYVNEYSPPALLCFINYIYTGKIFHKGINKCDLFDVIEVLVELCRIACDFKEDTLKDILVALLTRQECGIINVKIAFFIAQMAQKFDIVELLTACVDYMNFDWERNPEPLQKIIKVTDEKEIIETLKKFVKEIF